MSGSHGCGRGCWKMRHSSAAPPTPKPKTPRPRSPVRTVALPSTRAASTAANWSPSMTNRFISNVNMPSALLVARAFFPLEEELQLVPGHLTPTLQEQVVRLSTWMPFGQAVREFQWFTQVPLSEFLARQLTEAAGAAYV